MARTTQQWPTVPRPPLDVMPPAEDCTRDDLLDIAAAAIEDEGYVLSGQRAHLAAVCGLVREQEFALCALRDELQALTLDLEAARSDVAVLDAKLELAQGIGRRALAVSKASRLARRAVTEQLEAETSERVRLQTLCGKLAKENAELRHRALEAVTARIADADPVLRADRAREQAARQGRGMYHVTRGQREQCASALRSSSLCWDRSEETDVVDPEALDEPAVDRAPTPRVVTPTSMEIAYGGRR